MTSKQAGDMLARNPIFAVLSPERRRALAESGAPLQLNKGVRLFGRGAPADAAYAIISGELEVTIEGPDGRAVYIARLGSGNVVGEMGVLDGIPRATDVHATRRTDVWRIERALVVGALMDEPVAALALLAVLAKRLRDTDALVDRNASMELGKRLARLLLEEGRHGKIINDQSDIAHLIGASREAVNRKLAQWKKAGWVSMDHTGLHIADRIPLLALCSRRTAI